MCYINLHFTYLLTYYYCYCYCYCFCYCYYYYYIRLTAFFRDILGKSAPER